MSSNKHLQKFDKTNCIRNDLQLGVKLCPTVDLEQTQVESVEMAQLHPLPTLEGVAVHHPLHDAVDHVPHLLDHTLA